MARFASGSRVAASPAPAVSEAVRERVMTDLSAVIGNNLEATANRAAAHGRG
jgi:hypothetical protein